MGQKQEICGTFTTATALIGIYLETGLYRQSARVPEYVLAVSVSIRACWSFRSPLHAVSLTYK